MTFSKHISNALSRFQKSRKDKKAKHKLDVMAGFVQSINAQFGASAEKK